MRPAHYDYTVSLSELHLDLCARPHRQTRQGRKAGVISKSSAQIIFLAMTFALLFL